MTEELYYNDGGKHDNCTSCGKPVNFTDEEIKMMESGNFLYPDQMPFKKRKTKIVTWHCPHSEETGQNLYLLES